MSAPLPNSPANADRETEQRNVIVRRLTLAAILVLGLLGLLTLFDAFSTSPEENEATPYPNVVPVPPKRQIVQPVTPQPEPQEQEPALPEPAPDGDTLPLPEMPPVPEAPPVPQPMLTPEAPTLPSAQTVPPERPATMTRSATLAPKPSQPASSRPLPQVPGVVAPEFTAPLPPSESPPPQAVQSPQPALPPPAVRPQPVPPRPSPAYVVQAGVFTNFQRAEEIHAKLTLHGIPSTLETRVQVGPFKTQAEAETAAKKMRELGIESVILPPARSRP